MGWKPKVKVTLVKCGTCGKSYSNPFAHVCRIGFNQRGQRRVAKKRGGR